jgi:hypothetical protein
MKILVAILSIYILGLNFMPCNDSVADLNEQTSVHITTDQHDSHEHSADLCSPFCQCHCCHIHVVDFEVAQFEAISPEINSQNFLHFNNFGEEILNRILHPPRI